jgi:hypothetical protein
MRPDAEVKTAYGRGLTVVGMIGKMGAQRDNADEATAG